MGPVDRHRADAASEVCDCGVKVSRYAVVHIRVANFAILAKFAIVDPGPSGASLTWQRDVGSAGAIPLAELPG